MNNDFWVNNPSILFKNSKIFDILINKNNNFSENMNSTTRLILYLTIIIFLINKNNRILIIGFTLIIAIIVLYFVTKNKTNNNERIKETFDNILLNENINEKNNKIESTHYMPNSSNPMMNVLLPEIKYNNKRNSAAPSFNPEIENNINDIVKNNTLNELTKNTNIDKKSKYDKLNKMIFKDVTDNMDLDFSMRQFYTTPNTQVPNNQAAFAQYCYGDMISCKEQDTKGISCVKNMPPRWTNY